MTTEPTSDAAATGTPGSAVWNEEATDEFPLRISVAAGVGVITMHRPESRNAINPQMRQGLRDAVARLDADAQVHVMVLTGSDPAFCAGLDLRMLGERPSSLLREPSTTRQGSTPPFPERTTPLIGAVNGAAVTGGFELALNCDFLIASDRARFADTHARVGVMPGWGLTVLLADAIGRTRAREMSLTGNFITADEALSWGLVNRVVPHEELMPTVLGIAADIVGNDPVGVRRMLATYAAQQDADLERGWELESAGASAYAETARPGGDVAQRREAIIARGRSQI